MDVLEKNQIKKKMHDVYSRTSLTFFFFVRSLIDVCGCSGVHGCILNHVALGL